MKNFFNNLHKYYNNILDKLWPIKAYCLMDLRTNKIVYFKSFKEAHQTWTHDKNYATVTNQTSCFTRFIPRQNKNEKLVKDILE